MNTKPDYLDQLLDQAAAVAGSDYALAKLLDVNRSAISMWRSGTRVCQVENVVLLAEIAGLKPEEWAARALVAQYEGTAKGDKLYRALRKFLPAIGAVIASSGAHANAIFSTNAVTNAIDYFIRCILC